MRPATFRKLLEYVTRHYQVILLHELDDQIRSRPTKPLLVLSFDDGYYDFLEHALPLLHEYGINANHNIVNRCATENMQIWTQRMNHIFNYCRANGISLSWEDGQMKKELGDFAGWMEFYLFTYRHFLALPLHTRLFIISSWERRFSTQSSERMMNWQEVRQCMYAGTEIGSHTYSHDVLSTVHAEALTHEVTDAVAELQNEIGKPVGVIALPNGAGHPALELYAREAAIRHLLYVGDKINPYRDVIGKNPVGLHRINLVEEAPQLMFMRAELFHSKLRKYV
jgi:peptidoglycan/xylan/chitin deacetylase (PgdA/CDA1 family)